MRAVLGNDRCLATNRTCNCHDEGVDHRNGYKRRVEITLDLFQRVVVYPSTPHPPLCDYHRPARSQQSKLEDVPRDFEGQFLGAAPFTAAHPQAHERVDCVD